MIFLETAGVTFTIVPATPASYFTFTIVTHPPPPNPTGTVYVFDVVLSCFLPKFQRAELLKLQKNSRGNDCILISIYYGNTQFSRASASKNLVGNLSLYQLMNLKSN